MHKLLIVLSLSALLCGCVGIPANVRAVEDFDAERYVGT
jgi:lipocalin